MAFERMNDDLNIISKLGDIPGNDGITPQELKGLFDKASLLIQSYINNKLIPEIEKQNVGLPIGGGTMQGPINMNGQPIKGLNDPVDNNQAANKGYVDKKMSTELLWKNGQPDSAFPAQFVGVPEHDCEFYLVIAAVSGRTEASLICPAVGTGVLNAVYGTAGTGSGGMMIKNRGFNAVRTGIDFGGCYYTSTGAPGWISIDNSLVPTHIYGLKGMAA